MRLGHNILCLHFPNKVVHLLCPSILNYPRPYVYFPELWAPIIDELRKELIVKKVLMLPSNELPGIFWKSIITNGKRSPAFGLIAILKSGPGQPWIFKRSKVTKLKCAPPSKRTIHFSFMKLESVRTICFGNALFIPLSQTSTS